jgi:hypothetical protein
MISMAKTGAAFMAIALVTSPTTASGHGLNRPYPTVSYYYSVPAAYGPECYMPVFPAPEPVPIFCAPAGPQPVAVGVPGRQSVPATVQPPSVAPNYAPPTAAPPSSGPLQPTSFSSPSPEQVNESRRYYDVYPASSATPGQATDGRATIAFWNLTDRDLTLKVDGQERFLVRGKSLTMDLGRQFVWQVSGHDPQNESVARGETGLEIVIRR